MTTKTKIELGLIAFAILIIIGSLSQSSLFKGSFDEVINFGSELDKSASSSLEIERDTSEMTVPEQAEYYASQAEEYAGQAMACYSEFAGSESGSESGTEESITIDSYDYDLSTDDLSINICAENLDSASSSESIDLNLDFYLNEEGVKEGTYDSKIVSIDKSSLENNCENQAVISDITKTFDLRAPGTYYIAATLAEDSFESTIVYDGSDVKLSSISYSETAETLSFTTCFANGAVPSSYDALELEYSLSDSSGTSIVNETSTIDTSTMLSANCSTNVIAFANPGENFTAYGIVTNSTGNFLEANAENNELSATITIASLPDAQTDSVDGEVEDILDGIASQDESDADDDGLSASLERFYGTDPDNSDTDGDGYSDYREIQEETDPLDASDYPSRRSSGSGGSGGGGFGGSYYSGGSSGGASSSSSSSNSSGKKYLSIENPYKDVKKSDWYYEDALFNYYFEFMTGTKKGIFDGSNRLNRAQAITAIVRLSGEDLSNGSSGFMDVKPSDWFADYVATAKDKGWIHGTYFNPSSQITRGDFILWLVRSTGKTWYGFTEDDLFSDVDMKDSWSWAIAIAKRDDVLEGYDDGTAKPYSTLKRAEMAAFLKRSADAWYTATYK